MPFRRSPDGVGREGTRDRRGMLVRSEYRCWRDKVGFPSLIKKAHANGLDLFFRRLAGSFLEAGLSVSLSSNNEVFATDIYAASNQNVEPADTLKTSRRSKWGGRPVLLLICIRLGIDGVNPVYHDGLKV